MSILVKNLPANARDARAVGSVPGLGRSLGVENGNPLQYLEGLRVKLKLQYFGHLMRRADSLEKTVMLGKTEDKRRRGCQRMRQLDSITNSIDMSLSNVQWIGKEKGVWLLRLMGSQRIRHKLVTEQQPSGYWLQNMIHHYLTL